MITPDKETMDAIIRDKTFFDAQHFIQEKYVKVPEEIKSQLRELYSSLTVDNAADIYIEATNLVYVYLVSKRARESVEIGSGIVIIGTLLGGLGWLWNNNTRTRSIEETWSRFTIAFGGAITVVGGVIVILSL